MSFWSRLLGGKPGTSPPPKLDYLREALALERQGDYDAALTSYRLALRDDPSNHKVLQNMAIAYTKTGQPDQAIKCYRGALQLKPELSGAHYGLAFLLLKRGNAPEAVSHLEAFLANPPKGEEAGRWVEHARTQLATLRSATTESNDDMAGLDLPETP